jgi:hypothetical protein
VRFRPIALRDRASPHPSYFLYVVAPRPYSMIGRLSHGLGRRFALKLKSNFPPIILTSNCESCTQNIDAQKAISIVNCLEHIAKSVKIVESLLAQKFHAQCYCHGDSDRYQAEAKHKSLAASQ